MSTKEDQRNWEESFCEENSEFLGRNKAATAIRLREMQLKAATIDALLCIANNVNMLINDNGY